MIVFDFEADLLNQSSHLAATLGVTKFITVIVLILAHFIALLKSDLDVQHPPSVQFLEIWGRIHNSSFSS
jgi:hypothetical protein